jgi:hypothetical protein
MAYVVAASQPVGFWKKLASARSELLAGCTLTLRFQHFSEMPTLRPLIADL